MSAKRKADEFKVGLTVLLSLVVLTGGIMWGKRVSFKSEHQTYHVQFPSVYGLKEGSTVLIQGVAHGKVGTITLVSEGALVEVHLDREIILYEDSEVLLFAPQLMGGRIISINPGKGPKRLQPDVLLYGSVPSGMGEVMAASGEVVGELLEMIRQMRTTTMRLDSALVESRLGDRLNSSLEDLNVLTKALRTELHVATISLTRGAEDIEASGRELHILMADNRPRVDSIMVRMNRVAEHAERITANVHALSNVLSDSGGSLGRLLYSDTLHNQLVRTLAEIDSMAATIKEKGVQVKLF